MTLAILGMVGSLASVGARMTFSEEPAARWSPSLLYTFEKLNKILRYDETGAVIWEYSADTVRDIWLLPNGNVLFSYSINNELNQAETGAMEVTLDKWIVGSSRWSNRSIPTNACPTTTRWLAWPNKENC